MRRNLWEVKICAFKELVSNLLVQLGPIPSKLNEKSLTETYEELDTTVYISQLSVSAENRIIISVEKKENEYYREKTMS